MLKLKVSKAEGTWNCEKKKAVFLVYKSKQKKVKLLQFGSFNFDFHKKKLIRLNSTKTSFYVTLRKVFESKRKRPAFCSTTSLVSRKQNKNKEVLFQQLSACLKTVGWPHGFLDGRKWSWKSFHFFFWTFLFSLFLLL